MHVTFVAANKLQSGYFQQTVPVPEHILTVEDPSVPFSSISRLNNISIADGRPVFKVSLLSNSLIKPFDHAKVFSRTALSDELVNQLFSNATVVNRYVLAARTLCINLHIL